MPSDRLSVVIPTLNEEVDLPHALKEFSKLSRDIIIVDSNSTDQTVKIAKEFGARVVNHPFTSFSETRNFGDALAKGDWILSVEADVYPTKSLLEEIKAVTEDSKFDAYYIGRRNIIWGKEVRFTDWGPKDDRHIWLYKKGCGKWGNIVHEEFRTKGSVGFLSHHLMHNNYRTVSEFIGKINTYSEIASSKKTNLSNFHFIYDFFKRYFYKKGFLDGLRGLFLSYLQSVYYLTLVVKKYTND